jgi:hypothetical protein
VRAPATLKLMARVKNRSASTTSPVVLDCSIPAIYTGKAGEQSVSKQSKHATK